MATPWFLQNRYRRILDLTKARKGPGVARWRRRLGIWASIRTACHVGISMGIIVFVATGILAYVPETGSFVGLMAQVATITGSLSGGFTILLLVANFLLGRIEVEFMQFRQ